MQLKKYLAEGGGRHGEGRLTKLARACDVSISTITRIKEGQVVPSLLTAAKIVKHTGGAVAYEDLVKACQ